MIALAREDSPTIIIKANTRFDRVVVRRIKVPGLWGWDRYASPENSDRDAALTAAGFTRSGDWQPTAAAGRFGWWAEITEA